MQANVHCASSGADVDTSNSITSLARNNDSILDPIQSSGIRQLDTRAQQEPDDRFYTLYDRIIRPDVPAAAWDLVAANDGAPGVDGVRVQDIQNAPGGVEGP